MANSGAKLKAIFRVAPQDSHVVLVVLALIGGACLLVGFAFLWQDVEHPWVPLVLGILLLIAVGIFWVLSYEDIDARSSPSTHVATSVGDGQITVRTDARSLRSRQRMEALERIISMVLRRHPLPIADGLVDGSGRPVPGSAAEAEARVRAANDEAKRVLDQVFAEGEMVGNDRAARGEEVIGQYTLTGSPTQGWLSEVNRPGDSEDT